jgi:hypothetical protein
MGRLYVFKTRSTGWDGCACARQEIQDGRLYVRQGVQDGVAVLVSDKVYIICRLYLCKTRSTNWYGCSCVRQELQDMSAVQDGSAVPV